MGAPNYMCARSMGSSVLLGLDRKVFNELRQEKLNLRLEIKRVSDMKIYFDKQIEEFTYSLPVLDYVRHFSKKDRVYKRF
mmetsp:Transcript_35476/g.6395  ORF Transcript_35476/g.6395 Transcript_35476/m.6395 type:complete len:80 (+) Transcript_35476:344-583(+)